MVKVFKISDKKAIKQTPLTTLEHLRRAHVCVQNVPRLLKE